MKKRINLILIFVIGIVFFIVFYFIFIRYRENNSIITDYGDVEYSEYVSEIIYKDSINIESIVIGEIVGDGNEKVHCEVELFDEENNNLVILENNNNFIDYIDIDHTYVKILLDEKYQKYINLNLKADMADDQGKIKRKCSLKKIDDQIIDNKIGLYFENPYNYLLGTKINVHLIFNQKNNIIVVSNKFLQSDDNKYFIQIKDGENILKKYVKIGINNDEKSELLNEKNLEGKEIVISKYEYMQEIQE